jgi:hypothetical protein
MHYVTHMSHWMQKHMFSVMYSGMLLVQSVPVRPKHEKLCFDVSRPGRSGMLYVSRRTHWMQKHMFSVSCPDGLFVESIPGPPNQE